MKKEKLQAIATEFNELFGLDPEIDIEGMTTKIIANIKEAAEMIEPEDELTKETIAGLKELNIPMGEQEVDEEDNIPEEAIPEEINLVKEIEKADRVQDLRDIAKANEEFKSIRGMLTKWKTVESLQDVMLDLLEEAEEGKKDAKEKMKEEKPIVVPVSKKIEEKTIVKKENNKIISAMYLVRKMVCENPKITIDSIMQKLKNQHFNVNINSVKIRRSEMLHAISIMKELNKLK